MDTSTLWRHREKLAWAAAASAAIAIVLLSFFSFGQWLEFAPGHTVFTTRGVQDPNNPNNTITRSTQSFKSGDVYYNWVSIETFPSNVAIGGAALLLALAGWTAATSGNRGTFDQARLKRASNFAFVAVGIGVAGALWFAFSMWWEDYGEWWFDAGFYGLMFGGGTAAVLLKVLASAPQPESPQVPA